MSKQLKYIIFSLVVYVAAGLTAHLTAAESSKGAPSAAKQKGIRRTSAAVTVEGHATQERKMEILEHAAANRELAALTQVSHAQEMEEKAADLEHGQSDEALSDYTRRMARAGGMRKAAANLYGQAAANFDKASANRSMVAKLSKSMDKVAQQKKAESYSTNMKLRGDEAIQMAADACEAAAVAFDKAERPSEVAVNSQNAAVWLEKLATR